MRFYFATSSAFPYRLRLRLFASCCAATHLPLLAWIGWSAATGKLALGEFALLALATLAGAVIALGGVGSVLARLPFAQDAPEAPGLRSVPIARPSRRREDVVGSLLGPLNTAEARSRERDLAAKEDLLTGIRNRHGFLSDIADLLPAERRGAIALLDLNGFRRINDQFGHEVGDRVLRDFAGRLSSELRRGDLIARWDGEEFAVLFRGATEDEAAGVLSRVTRRLIVNPLILLDGEALTFSAGVCRFGGDGIDATLASADDALAVARQAGRSRVACAGRPGQVLLPLA
ncbi:diguanylate cyclase (GGDEF)-like protein [Sphingomonas naasensis]|uniref:diguanylate cyclase n=1 Tax=Sphingomonas naasensis TaxID=1344951 RepID=A0A4S1WJ28_9SPHN|nr:GGDEF domain-containing protein [Sphingomonas naasensis]NIJ21983.1 diguanylate cyclase (GGDEF)-like protein [Sphingomonas naasensis]TGX42335.1 GGDEF domain-containing protein [Sphingomonas naasensis]